MQVCMLKMLMLHLIYTAAVPHKSIFREAIKRKMDEYNVQKRKVPFEQPFYMFRENYQESRRYILVKGFAWFNCEARHAKKKKPWPSAHAWCAIDLKMQRICRRYKQKCNKCETRVRPMFTPEAIEKMVTYAVKVYLIKIGAIKHKKRPGTETDETIGGRHDEKRCEMCKILGHSCWK